MSTWYSATVRCPACTHDFEGRFLRGANASRAPELRALALSNGLNRAACPRCGRVHELDAEVVYTDPGRGHWISVARRSDLDRWAAVEQSAMTAFRTGLETTAAVRFADARMRVVFDLDELRERLAIWEAGLDDAVVECVKLDCLRECPTMRGPRDRLRVVRIEPFTMHVLDAQGAIRAELGVAAGAVDRVAADAEWRTRFPDLFTSGFVSIDRYLR